MYSPSIYHSTDVYIDLSYLKESTTTNKAREAGSQELAEKLPGHDPQHQLIWQADIFYISSFSNSMAGDNPDINSFLHELQLAGKLGLSVFSYLEMYFRMLLCFI